MELEDRARLALAVPLAAGLGLRLLVDDDPAAGAWCELGELAGNGAGGAHAAALGVALELAAYLAVAPHLADGEHAVTHMSAITLVRAARLGDRVEVRGTLDRRTRRVAFAGAVATVGGDVVARGSFTKSVLSA